MRLHLTEVFHHVSALASFGFAGRNIGFFAGTVFIPFNRGYCAHLILRGKRVDMFVMRDAMVVVNNLYRMNNLYKLRMVMVLV
jgi:hypothetical protein